LGNRQLDQEGKGIKFHKGPKGNKKMRRGLKGSRATKNMWQPKNDKKAKKELVTPGKKCEQKQTKKGERETFTCIKLKGEEQCVLA